MSFARACVVACVAAFPRIETALATRRIRDGFVERVVWDAYDRSTSEEESSDTAEYDADLVHPPEDTAQTLEDAAQALEGAALAARASNDGLRRHIEMRQSGDAFAQALAGVDDRDADLVQPPEDTAQTLEDAAQALEDAALAARAFNDGWRRQMQIEMLRRHSRRQDAEVFAQALARFDDRFRLLADLGYFAWRRDCPERDVLRACHGDVRIEELRCGLGVNGEDPRNWLPVPDDPDASGLRLADVDRIRRRLPMTLPVINPPPWMYRGFPCGQPHQPPPVAALLVASQRLPRKLSGIDFFIGGSALYTLASGDLNGNFTVHRWRGIVMILAYRAYYVDLTSKGFMFERLLTDRRLRDMDPHARHLEHLCVLRVGGFKVLVSAEVDAVDERRRPVELTTAYEPKWNLERFMFQLMSLASVRLLNGRMHYDQLHGIKEHGLQAIVGKFPADQRRRFADNIIYRLRAIRASMGDGPELRDFGEFDEDGAPRLRPLPVDGNRSLFPPDADVLRALFPNE